MVTQEKHTETLKLQIIDALKGLSPAQYAKVLTFTKHLHSPLPQGIPGEVLLARAREINFDPQGLEEMAKAIEEGCERV